VGRGIKTNENGEGGGRKGHYNQYDVTIYYNFRPNDTDSDDKLLNILWEN